MATRTLAPAAMLLTATLFSARVCGAGCLQPPNSQSSTTHSVSVSYTVTVTAPTQTVSSGSAHSGGVLAVMRRALPSIWRAAGSVAGSSSERNRG